MAQVYEAEDLELGQSVAIKVLRSDIANDVRATSLLKTEVRLARRVTHPNVCRIFDVFHHPAQDENGSRATVLVVAMELLHGETLTARLRRGRLFPAEALPLIRQIADGLAAAHAAGVAHLDLKSGNVVLVPDRDGVRAVITDFGLAQRMDLADRPAAGSTGFRGTAAYMAPEQVAGREVTAAADLYAFGVVVYEMVTGRLPFRGVTPRATAEKRLTELPTPPSVHAPDLSPAWEQAILQCLARDPARRFGSALEFAARLEGASSEPAAKPFEWKRPAAIFFALILLASIMTFLPPRREPTAQRLYAEGTAALKSSEALAAVRLLERAVAIDPAFGLAHLALADAWADLGHLTKAKTQAQRAVELAAGLSQEHRLAVEGRHAELHGQWEKAIQRYQALWTFFPSNLEYALRLAAAQTAAGRGRGALATIETLRRSRPSLEDPRIDLAEAKMAGSQADFRRQVAVASRCASRARASRKWRILGQAKLQQGEALRELGEYGPASLEQLAARAAFVRAGDRAGFAKATHELALTDRYANRLPLAERKLATALPIFRAMGNRAGEAEVMYQLAQIAHRSGRSEEAFSEYKAALVLFHQIGHLPGESRVRADLAHLLATQGRLAESERMLEQDLIVKREFRDLLGEAFTLLSLAEQVRHRDLARGTRLLEEALSICDQTGSTRCSANVLLRLGCARREAGHFAGAEASLSRARELFRAMGSFQAANQAELRLGRLYLEQGRAGEAASLVRSALQEFRRRKTPAPEGIAWTLLAAALGAQGKRTEAAEALAQARPLLPRIQCRVETLRTRLMQAQALRSLGEAAVAGELLARAERDAKAMGSPSLRIEAALARATLGRGGRGDCSPLVALAAEAGAHSFDLLAAKATAARRSCQRTL
jgi:tetratricopeptide (TPR) repeat protein